MNRDDTYYLPLRTRTRRLFIVGKPRARAEWLMRLIAFRRRKRMRNLAVMVPRSTSVELSPSVRILSPTSPTAFGTSPPSNKNIYLPDLCQGFHALKRGYHDAREESHHTKGWLQRGPPPRLVWARTCGGGRHLKALHAARRWSKEFHAKILEAISWGVSKLSRPTRIFSYAVNVEKVRRAESAERTVGGAEPNAR